jgi:hypothetical protein
MKEFDVVKLISERPELPVGAGAVGTIVMVHTGPPEAFEVEFVEREGETYAVPGEVLELVYSHPLKASS